MQPSTTTISISPFTIFIGIGLLGVIGLYAGSCSAAKAIHADKEIEGPPL